MRACKPFADHWPPCPDPKQPDPNNPRCDGIKVPPVFARIVGNNISGSQLLITIGAGSAQGITKDWKATVMKGASTTETLGGGEVTIVRVDKTTSVGAVKLTPDQLSANGRVRLQAP